MGQKFMYRGNDQTETESTLLAA